MTRINAKTVVQLHGRGTTTLYPKDHVATGGEGAVYRTGKTMVKIYTDAQRMQRGGFVEKIRTLARFSHPHIVAPTNIVSDAKGTPIGFYMPRVEGEPLARVFTNDFRLRTGFGDADAHTLVDRMRAVVQYAHDHKALMVDANEMNWMAVKDADDSISPRVIDVDSWAIGRWGAQVVMPSIRDWHSKGFSVGTDWFAWGIVTFQIYTGIHPYKGPLTGYKAHDMQKRMQDNASVFHKGARLNRAVRDFSCIPAPLLDWYVATFSKAERTIPPSPYDTGAIGIRVPRIARTVHTAQGNLVFTKIYDGARKIIRIFPCGIALSDAGELVLLKSGRVIATGYGRDTEVVALASGWLAAECVDGVVQVTSIDHKTHRTQKHSLAITAERVLRAAERLFVVTDGSLVEIAVRVLGKTIVSLGQKWGVQTTAATWFDGVGVQDSFGAMYLIVPFGDKHCAHLRVAELDGMCVINARAGSRFITLVALDKNGDYHKYELCPDKTYIGYTIWHDTVDAADINIAILPKGVCATIVKDGTLDIFVPANGTHNRVHDRFITTTMTLAHHGNTVLFIKDGAVWQVRMK